MNTYCHCNEVDCVLYSGHANAVCCCLKAVSDGSHFALQDMSNAIKRSVVSTYLNVPEPLVASDAVAAVMYPWRAFISKYVHCC